MASQPPRDLDPIAVAAALPRATLLKLALLQAREAEEDEEHDLDKPTLPPKSAEYDIHRSGEPWQIAIRRVGVRGFVKPTQEERNADGTALLGRTVF
eukprot:COSAG03_NODE_9191_length_739_cov_1.090625_1_plen_96_part_10